MNGDWVDEVFAGIPSAEPYHGVRCMCVDTNCRPPVRGPGCPHYCEHCRKHIEHAQRNPNRPAGL